MCAALSAVGSGGCLTQKPTDKPPEVTATLPTQKAVDVTEADFAVAVHRLMRHGRQTPERSALLAGTVRRQLAHAAAHFDRKDSVRGTRAVVGALYLLRMGEARSDMIGPMSAKALAGAIERFSARGDEGRAIALMLMQKKLLLPNSAEAKQLQLHLSALQRWMSETRTGGDMEILAANERAAVGRSLVEPTEESLVAAAKAVSAWIDRAIEYNLAFQETRRLPPREEAAEAFRALQAGSHVMAAVFLRHGRAKSALKVIERSSAGRVSRPSFFSKLRSAAENDTAEDWRVLAREFARLAYGAQNDGPHVDSDLLDAALWGTALEAYRRDPSSLAMAHILASHLIAYGMPETAPLVLRDALGAKPSGVSLAGAMGTIVDALSNEYDTGSTETARRIFASSEAVLALADGAAFRSKLQPSSAQVRQLMASIELRSGNMDAARPLLVAALQAEPTVWGYTMLGVLERQVGNDDVALAHARRASALPAARATHLDAADAKLLVFEILRDKGAKPGAEAALEQALGMALHGRKLGRSPAQTVRAERTLARVLDGYGERKSASRAIGRALQIAGNHRQMLAPTMLAAIGRALVVKDIVAARAALQIGIKAAVDEDDLVYGALWLMLLERQLDEVPDGKVDRVLLTAVNGNAWPAKLARWARGLLTDAQLRSSADSYAERAEAEFYIAVNANVAGQSQAKEQLLKLAANPLIEIMEVRLARDLLAPRLAVKVPSKYRLP